MTSRIDRGAAPDYIGQVFPLPPGPAIAPPPPLVAAYLEHRAFLLRLLTARTGNAAEAEDIVQEMYERLATLPDSGGAVENAPAFLNRMALNLAFDRQRSGSRAAARDGEWLSANALVEGEEPIAEAPTAEDVVAGRQELRLLRDAIDALPPQGKRVFEMHKLQGRPHAEVAASLGISRSAVEKHMAAAMKNLLKRLGRRLE
ncbi:RNA polymerase sigma factor [Niveispirillum sp.]|uniref:RNA polymerase sigma factor n=1 Tax=Niveispirillum sp. TaxID=1917217 RepID=UPI001B56423B|nr:RNA polymerase sigma factor [Niveispirillum sp.]MBP7337005.1 RNA polymerase sigma factor [Niveispirillum sp.]